MATVKYYYFSLFVIIFLKKSVKKKVKKLQKIKIKTKKLYK